jgi:hypothetical protein
VHSTWRQLCRRARFWATVDWFTAPEIAPARWRHIRDLHRRTCRGETLFDFGRIDGTRQSGLVRTRKGLTNVDVQGLP